MLDSHDQLMANGKKEKECDSILRSVRSTEPGSESARSKSWVRPPGATADACTVHTLADYRIKSHARYISFIPRLDLYRYTAASVLLCAIRRCKVREVHTCGGDAF